MAIRISGMISGLDTDSIVKELVSAYSTKKDNMVKEQTKLEWKIDAWKELNTKINNFYSKSLSDMRFTKAFNQKTTSVSDPAKATVKADNTAVNGTQALKIGQLASSDSIVGGKFTLASGGKVTGNTTLGDLGYAATGDATIWVKNGTNGAMQHIDVTKDTTVNNFVSALKTAGLNANFDEGQQRLYVSAKNSGKENAFELISDSADGFKALKAFGVLKKDQTYTLTRSLDSVSDAEWQKELEQLRKDILDVKALAPEIKKLNDEITPLDTEIQPLQEIKKLNDGNTQLKDEIEKLTENLNKATTEEDKQKIQNEIKTKQDTITSNENEIKKIIQDNSSTIDSSKSVDDLMKRLDELLQKKAPLQSKLDDLLKQQKTLQYSIDYNCGGSTYPNGEALVAAYDDPTTQADAITALRGRVKDAVTQTQWEKELEQLRKDYKKVEELDKQITPLNEQITKLEKEKTDNAATLTEADKKKIDDEITKIKGERDGFQAQKDALMKYVDYNYGTDAKSGQEILADYANPVNQPDAIAALKERVKARNNEIAAIYTPDMFTTPGSNVGWASRTEAKDAVISLDGVMYESSSNTFSVNGLTITAQSATGSLNVDADGKIQSINGDALSITTSTDVDGIYNMIKGFLKEYNALITEMDTLYNAKSAKGYMPLTDDEKDKMSETEVEKWEKKIKDSLLRRDATLGSVSSAMKSAMTKSYDVEGKTYSLASFGIKTLSYFLSGENEKGVYHIDGDSEDSNTKGEKDKLRSAIATDPEGVASFFTQFAKGVYTTLDEKMTSIKNVRSRYSVYNDKTMQKEYDDYTSRIKEWEKRIKTYEDSYYDKFSKMESALSKLQSQTSSLTSMLGLGG